MSVYVELLEPWDSTSPHKLTLGPFYKAGWEDGRLWAESPVLGQSYLKAYLQLAWLSPAGAICTLLSYLTEDGRSHAQLFAFKHLKIVSAQRVDVFHPDMREEIVGRDHPLANLGLPTLSGSRVRLDRRDSRWALGGAL